MNGLDLFSGIGGLTKALEGYVRPIAYCENDRYAQSVLLSRMVKAELPRAPIWDDIRTLRAGMLPGFADVIYGGFPCQDISVAGRGEGLEGERSGLFFEIARLVGEIRPRFVFLENVAAITVRGADRVVGELCKLGYDCRWGILSAADVGANHRRERWWCLAKRRANVDDTKGGELRDDGANQGSHSRKVDTPTGSSSLRRKENVAHVNGERGSKREDEENRERRNKPSCIDTSESGKNVADTSSTISPRLPIGEETTHAESRLGGWWTIEPNVGRVANGIPLRVDRLRGLGNAVVPAQAREAFERLLGIK